MSLSTSFKGYNGNSLVILSKQIPLKFMFSPSCREMVIWYLPCSQIDFLSPTPLNTNGPRNAFCPIWIFNPIYRHFPTYHITASRIKKIFKSWLSTHIVCNILPCPTHQVDYIHRELCNEPFSSSTWREMLVLNSRWELSELAIYFAL